MAQPWNLGPPVVDFSPIGKLGDTLVSAWDKAKRQGTIADLGKDLQSGNFESAAQKAFAIGDTDTGLGIMKMGLANKDRVASEAATRGLFDALGGGSTSIFPPPERPSKSISDLDSSTASPAALIQSESGGNWQAQNSAVGSSGRTGHFGRLQFGRDRLDEAIAAGALPPGTTAQAFMASPDLQRSAEAWHFQDIERFIGQSGLDRAVGQNIAGVPITVEGMKYAAHLGGKDGMKRFIESGGRYNPTDANGTSLLDYLAKGARASGSRGAQADMPAAGARPVSQESGRQGFVIPGEDQATLRADADAYERANPEAARQLRARADAIDAATGQPVIASASSPMTGRTFEAIHGGGMEPAFKAEGLRQDWMGTALAPQPGEGRQIAAARANTPLPPTRPADLPAPGAVPAVGQMPQAVPPDLSNTPDAGARDFAQSQGRNAPQAAQTRPDAGGVPMPVQQPAAAQAAFDPRADLPASNASTTLGRSPAPMFGTNMPRPTNAQEALEYWHTRAVEADRGSVTKLAQALANPKLPANARAIGEIFLKEALEKAKAPDSVKEFMYAKGMGWTTAKNPAEYAKEKSKTSPVEEVEARKAAASAAGLKPGDAGYQGFILTNKMPREDMGPLTATDKKAILEAEEGVLAAETSVQALREAKTLSPRAHSGVLPGARAWIGNNLPDRAVPDSLASPGSAEATSTLENVVTSQALAQLKSIFGAAPTEGERKILMEIQGSIGQPDNVRQKIYDRGIAMAEKRLAFNRQRAADLRGGDYYKPQDRRSQPPGQPATPPQPQAQPSVAPQGARQAPDGNWYVADPNRPGKYLMVQ